MDDTKDYIINLRVSRQTYDKIRDKARKNGDSISGLIRMLIDDSAEIISDISNDLRGGKRHGPARDVESYHRATLARDRACDGCGTRMHKGQVVSVGETAKDGSYYFCDTCK